MGDGWGGRGGKLKSVVRVCELNKEGRKVI